VFALAAALRIALILLLLWLAFAVGMTTWDESTQAMVRGQPTEIGGVLIALAGGALMMLLLAAACVVAAGARSELAPSSSGPC
jgi:hypothetical protein